MGGLALGGAGWWRQQELRRFLDTPFGDSGERVVTIAPGAKLPDVAVLLREAGVIADAEQFRRAARMRHVDRSLKAGVYEFACPVAPSRVLDVLAAGRVKLYTVTIAEGLRLDEVARAVAAAGLAGADDLLRLAHDPAVARSLGVNAPTVEGYLFPDTYAFPRAPKPEAILRKMVERYRDEYRKADQQRKAGLALSEHEAVTLASIVEKETGVPEERARVSCVFHNRLRKGMRLGADPTVIYATLLATGTFDGNLKSEDLRRVHPYNTYTTKGLPPGPIANPGAAALRATLNPLDCEDLFFVAKCNGRGTHEFCPDYACHQRYERLWIRCRRPKGT